MSDEECPTENQARIRMKTSAANGFDGAEVEVVVEGGESETVSDIEDAAKRRFAQAVDANDVEHSNRPGYQ